MSTLFRLTSSAWITLHRHAAYKHRGGCGSFAEVALQAAMAVLVNMMLAFFACGIAFLVAQGSGGGGGRGSRDDDEEEDDEAAATASSSSSNSVLHRLQSQLTVMTHDGRLWP